MTTKPLSTDVLVIGWGWPDSSPASEALDAGRRVVLVDQEPRTNLGGQAWWSFGGLFFIDSPEQRRLGIKDSLELATQDWFGNAGFDRPEDEWPRRWAEAYLQFAAGEKRSWLRERGVGFFPSWAGRNAAATAPSDRATRFHDSTSLGAPGGDRRTLRSRHRAGRAGRTSDGPPATPRLRARGDRRARSPVRAGNVLASSGASRGAVSSREIIGEFEIAARATIVSSGGIGGNHNLVRAAWPERLGTPPEHMLTGVPAYVDGSMYSVSAAAGARFINGDRMWHYVEGITNWDPVWPSHGIRILPGPSSLWLDATGQAPPGTPVPRVRHAGNARAPAYDRSRSLLVRHLAADRREGVRALGQRTEPRPHRQRCSAAAEIPSRQGTDRAGAVVPRRR